MSTHKKLKHSVIQSRNIGCVIAACLCIALFHGYAQSEEISPFRITGVDGELYFRYFTDEYEDRFAGELASYQDGTTTEQGLDVTFRSYIYHPNFFRLDFGGGPVFVQHTYDSDITDYSDNDNYLNLHARASILEKKPYPLVLYYDRYSSTTPYAVQDRMLLTNEKYGLNFQLRRPVIPAELIFDLSHSEIDGDNLQRITDEKIDRASMKLTGDLGPNGDGTMSYSWMKTQSASGSTTLPINPTEKTTHLFNIRTEHLFGYDEWIRFTNDFIYKEQDLLPDLEEYRYTPNLRLTHSRNLRSYYRYSYRDRTANEIDTTSHGFNAGLSHLSLDDRLETNVDAHADQYDTEGLQERYYEGTVNLSYLQPYEGFNVRYSGGWGMDYTDREADVVSVFSESHTLDSFNSFQLDNRNVIEPTVVIRNVQGTQTYRVDIDYELVTIADVTEVRWLNLSDIPERVLVDYSYDPGGTAEFISYRQRYRIDFTRGNYLKLYAQYRSIERDLQSGNPTVPLNSQRTATTGIDVDYPLANEWIVGGDAVYENHDADVGSYKRNGAGVYVQIPNIIKGNLRLFADRLLVDNLDSPEDVDLTRYGLRYYSRPWRRTLLNADYVEETDTGGRVDRSNTRASVRLSWFYRQLEFSADGRYYTNTTGESERDRSSLNLELTRKF
jgi:hypothetical protein